jgi:hypothetical protein
MCIEPMHMEMKIKNIALLFFFGLPAVLTACSIMSVNPLTVVTPDVRPVYETITARLATAKTIEIVTPSPLATRSEALASIPTMLPNEIQPSPDPEPERVLFQAPVSKGLCDLVSPDNPMDVTIPDGTQFRPGEAFSKTWRLVNAGSCSWTSEYSVVWFSGQKLNAASQQKIPYPVQPGASVEVTLDMSAPEYPGFYQSNWKLRNPDGKLFGLGPNGDSPFWVQIEVIEANTPTPVSESSETESQLIYANGFVTLNLNDSLNLNTGELNQEGRGDLLFTISPQDRMQFIPENGAQFAFWGKELPSAIKCQSAVLDTSPIQVMQEDAGTYFCYRTGQGLPGFAHVVNPPNENRSISLDFVTWSVP